MTGSLTTEYLYDQQLSPSPADTVQNQGAEYLNVRWRNLSGPDVRLYFNGMYSHDFLTQGNDLYRIYKLFVEWNELGSVLNIRAGRQPGSGNTLFSRFDGVTLGYKFSPLLSVNVGGGFPVNTSFRADRAGMQTDRRFYEIYAMLYDWFHVTGRLYFSQELYQSFLTRSAVGWNSFWTKGNVNLSTMLDYDLNFARLNEASLGADYAWGIAHYSAGVEYRKTPFLDAQTAMSDPTLCGATPPINSFADLTRQLSRDQIESCAIKNTSDMVNVRGTVSIDFSKVWRGELRYVHEMGQAVEFTTTGGVTTAGRTDRRTDRFSLFLMERNGLQVSDTWTLLLLYEPSTDMKRLSVYSTLSKYWGNALQASLRFQGDQITIDASNIRTTNLSPGLILNYALPSGINASLEADYAITMSSGGTTINTVLTRTTLTIPF